MPLSLVYVILSKLHWAFVTAAGVTNVSASLSSIVRKAGGNACKPHVPVHIVVSYQVCAWSFNAAHRIVVLL
jgi:hypothetical protein